MIKRPLTYLFFYCAEFQINEPGKRNKNEDVIVGPVKLIKIEKMSARVWASSLRITTRRGELATYIFMEK